MSSPAATEGLPIPPVRDVSIDRPLRWLLLGWRDFTHVMFASALHGLIFALFGLALLAFAWGRFYLLSGAFSGFLLVAPVLVTGLYELSRLLARGERPGLREVFAAWRRGTRPLVWFGLILMLAGTLWVLLSSVLIALFVKVPIGDLESFVRNVVLSPDSYLFEAWLLLGGLLAALTFAATVVSAPLMLDRDVDLITAVLTSVNAVSANPLAMAIWATIIMFATALGMATMLIGLVLVIPVLGHASWHAYVDLVDASALPARR
jgi:uncharacterized membrane protein